MEIGLCEFVCLFLTFAFFSLRYMLLYADKSMAGETHDCSNGLGGFLFEL